MLTQWRKPDNICIPVLKNRIKRFLGLGGYTMNQVRLVTDSSCDLLTLSGMDFVSVPLTIRTETEEFRDDAALDVDGTVR